MGIMLKLPISLSRIVNNVDNIAGAGGAFSNVQMSAVKLAMAVSF